MQRDKKILEGIYLKKPLKLMMMMTKLRFPKTQKFQKTQEEKHQPLMGQTDLNIKLKAYDI